MKGRKLLCEDFMRTKPAKFTDSLESQWELKHLLTALQCDITSQCFSLEEANTYHESKCHMPSLSLSLSFPDFSYLFANVVKSNCFEKKKNCRNWREGGHKRGKGEKFVVVIAYCCKFVVLYISKCHESGACMRAWWRAFQQKLS